MKKIWESWLKEGIFLYCVIYTATTIVNSVAYLSQGVRNDPSGNWHTLALTVVSITNPDFHPDMESTSSYGWYHKALYFINRMDSDCVYLCGKDGVGSLKISDDSALTVDYDGEKVTMILKSDGKEAVFEP